MIVWLDYKRCRRERYKSDLSVKKCLMQLKRLANNDPHVAWQIIDQSIARRYGERTFDRLTRLCRVVEFRGESLR